MIFYFSGAGNSQFIAETLSKKLNEPLVSMADALKTKNLAYTVERESTLGFVCPIHFWGVPNLVLNFIKEVFLKMNSNTYTWVVFTCGGSTGNADKMIAKHLKQKNINLSAVFSIKMTDIFVPFFHIPEKDVIDQTNFEAVKYIDEIVSIINNREYGNYDKNKGKFHNLSTFFLYPTYSYYRKTSKFRVSDDCTACRKCEKVCPTNTIEIINNKPVWKKNKCTLCFACLHICPVKAINYGRVLFFWDSKDKGR